MKRASAAIREYESEIRNRVRFTTSMLQPLPSYEILHDIGSHPFDFARLDRIDCDRFSRDATTEPEGALGNVRYAAGVHFSIGKFAANDLALWPVHKLPGEC